MKKKALFIIVAIVSIVAMAGKPRYSGRYDVVMDNGRKYSIQVDIYKTYIMVGKQRCPSTNRLNGWEIFHAGTNGGYTSLYYVDPQTYEMRKVIQHDGEKKEYAMLRQDTTDVVNEVHYQCKQCNGTGRVAVNKPWNSGMNRDEPEVCRECGLEYYKSAGHRHENCPHCAGRGYTLE
jgi:hypothetical protein